MAYSGYREALFHVEYNEYSVSASAEEGYFEEG
jgi:hypothetical protein